VTKRVKKEKKTFKHILSKKKKNFQTHDDSRDKKLTQIP